MPSELLLPHTENNFGFKGIVHLKMKSLSILTHTTFFCRAQKMMLGRIFMQLSFHTMKSEPRQALSSDKKSTMPFSTLSNGRNYWLTLNVFPFSFKGYISPPKKKHETFLGPFRFYLKKSKFANKCNKINKKERSD